MLFRDMIQSFVTDKKSVTISMNNEQVFAGVIVEYEGYGHLVIELNKGSTDVIHHRLVLIDNICSIGYST